MIQDPFLLLTAFAAVVFTAIVLIEKSEIARKLSPVILILFLGAVLSNTGLIAGESPFYGHVIDFTVPFAVCLVLFSVRLADLKKAGPAMLAAFFIASIGTVLGTVTASLILQSGTYAIMGNESWKLAGPYVGTYIGGSLNFFSLWTGLEIGNQDLLAAANAVDNMTVVPIFAFWILVTERIRRFFPIGEFWKTGENEEERDRVKEVPHRLSIKEITILSLCALSIIALSNWINDRLIAVVFEGLPTILIITTFALIVAQLPFARKLKGAGELGNLSFYFFFAAVGAMIDIVKAVSLAPILFLYVMIIIALQILLALLIGRLFKLDIRMLAVGSIAAKCGPPTVIAITNVMEWKRLLLPGIAVALLGYAIGNYIGFGAAYLIKFLLGM